MKIDDFEDLSNWSTFASGQAEIQLSQQRGPRGTTLQIDYDFRGGGGFVVARRSCKLSLPEAYAFCLDVRGSAPPNNFEMKLCDPTGYNVWWYKRDAFVWPEQWQPLRIAGSDIEFAWGPAGSGPPGDITAIEFVITAGPGGKGRVCIHDLRLNDTSFVSVPVLRASSAVAGFQSDGTISCKANRRDGDHSGHYFVGAFDATTGTGGEGWRSEPASPQWFLLDFGERREYGGLIIDWTPGAAACDFDVSISDHGRDWNIAQTVRNAAGSRSYLYLPKCESRYLRLDLHRSEGSAGFGIAAFEVQPHDFSRSMATFFQEVAARHRAGAYPKYLGKAQTYWSPVGLPGGSSQGLLNEEGMLETDLGGFSLEPFLHADGELITWADASIAQSLEDGFLPIPSSCWDKGDLRLTTTTFAFGTEQKPVLYVRYRVEKGAAAGPGDVVLFVAIRPFQVVPPWQGVGVMGGPSSIWDLHYRDETVYVNGNRQVLSLTPVAGFGAASFHQGPLIDYLRSAELPPRSRVGDDFGYASGILRYDLKLDPGQTRDVFLAIPFGTMDDAARPPLTAEERDAARLFERAVAWWERTLGTTELCLPPQAHSLFESSKTAAAHILTNRDGPALQPGPRRYARTWIRDAATMSAALLRVGCNDEVRDFLTWYAKFQRPDGAIPAIVDRNGIDPLPEHDSHGQFLYTIAQYFRFSDDRDFLRKMWPAMLATVGYIETLRALRLGPEFLVPDKKSRYGLLPESVSHEGYLAQPVHAYWDDFWTLRGLKDVTSMAEALGETDAALRLATLRDSFRTTLYASILATMEERGVPYIPASVEWADSDPSATATAITTVDELEHLPAAGLERTIAEYFQRFDDCRSGRVDWANYTPYEIRLIGALVRLGKRERALELLYFFVGDRRPAAWNSWAEIVWRDPKAPAHIGDMPHTWIAAEFVLALRSLFLFSREKDSSLVLAAGLDPQWLADGFEVSANHLPTVYGTLSYALKREGESDLILAISGALTMPPGGLVLRPPLPGPLLYAEVDGERLSGVDTDGVTVRSCPSSVRLHCQVPSSSSSSTAS